ncbi:hypothetical protein FRB95_005541 [Tulasnella sp. JGI-2019a]|nr:hypothetical protein FRB93_002399 [Tulasnella sp. JGI-2019a]KAG9029267.1 hypothetical protein FRB95_005541 [Tulasnella sp. JGI-2019a]
MQSLLSNAETLVHLYQPSRTSNMPSFLIVLFNLFVTTLFILVINKLYQYVTPRSSLPYPPGPPGDFFIGSLRQMPSEYAWSIFTEWAHKYGPITYINVAGDPVVIVNTQEAAMDLLEKRSAIYSDRPRFVMACELSGLDQSVALMDSGPGHTKQRKIMQQALHPRVVAKDYTPIQERFTHRLAKNLLDEPDKFTEHFGRCIAGTIQTLTYGEDHGDGEVDYVELGMTNARQINSLVRGYVVDYLPWLRYIPEWFPGAQFKRYARTVRETAQRAQWLPYNMVKAKAATGNAPPSYVLAALEAMDTPEGSDYDDQTISMSASTLLSAGSDTTTGALSALVYAMLLHPDVQARAQAELDHIFGDQLPTVAGRDSTPYLNAIMAETFRWSPPVPVDVPHSVKQDDVYNGYFIPAGTRVLANAWAILRNEKDFPNPNKFDPDRFLAKYSSPQDEGAIDPRPDPLTIVFGYGRRACPGIHVAQSGLWLAMATILSCFDIRPKIDPKTMKPMILEPKFTGFALSVPSAHVCDIKPRSRSHANRILEAVDN